MPNRKTHEKLNLRCNYTESQLLQMASDIADAYNRMESVEEEESTVRAQFKERKTSIEQTIGSLARRISQRYEMADVECELLYDTPNVNEVSYRRTDTGEIAKVRPATQQERQQELELDEPATGEAEAESVAASEEAVEEFFDSVKQEAESGEEVPEKTGVSESRSAKSDDMVDF